MNFKVKMGLSRINAMQLLALGRKVVQSLTGNANFPTPSPELPVLEAALDNLEGTILAARGGGLEAHQNKRTAVGETEVLMRALAAYVDGVARGDRDLILNAGFETNKVPERRGKLPAPVNLLAKPSSFEGTVELDWDVVVGSNQYTVYMKDSDPNDEQPWLPVHSTTKSKCSISDLEPGRFYWFRVSAFGTAGSSPASDPARSFAA